jgi:hypothetical protein
MSVSLVVVGGSGVVSARSVAAPRRATIKAQAHAAARVVFECI